MYTDRHQKCQLSVYGSVTQHGNAGTNLDPWLLLNGIQHIANEQFS